MSVALDSTGFKRPQYDDLVSDMTDQAKAKYGENVNVSERSFLGIILRIFAWFLSKLWQDSEDVYYSGYKNTATGNNLDRLGPSIGITRNLEQTANGAVTLTGTANYTVLAGFRVGTETGVMFETVQDVTLDGDGSGTVQIVAVESASSGNVAAGTITVIVNPDANVTSVTNAVEAAGGREKETDQEFRARWDLSVAGGGGATADSIRSALLGVSGVRAAAVIENSTSATDSDGRPAKSFQAYVLGGEAPDIGAAIFAKKAAGIASFGDQSVTVTDLAGFTHTVKFSYASEIAVYVRMTISTSSSFTTDGAGKIRTAIIQYIGGADSDGTVYAGLSMGDDVIYSKLIAATMAITGVTDVAIEVSTDGTNWSSGNIAIDPQEVPQTAADHVTVTMA